MRVVLLDTGPLVALLSARDSYHHWARATFESLSGTLVSCEAVLTETCFLLRTSPAAVDAVLERVERRRLKIESLATESTAIRRMMWKYRGRPMSFADASLVRLAERFPRAQLLTLDRDFTVYRRNGRQRMALVAPFV